jgi:hypothetical protein
MIDVEGVEESLLAAGELRRASNAGVTRTSPIFEAAKPLSMARIHRHAKAKVLLLNQTLTPAASSKSCSSLAAPCRSFQAWQRKQSRRSGFAAASFSTASRTGVRDAT